jgi:hypothetical protein
MTPPLAGFSAAPPDGLNGWYVSPIVVLPEGSDATSGIASQEVSLDNANWTAAVTVSTDGIQTVYERLLDAAGNAATGMRTIRLDTTPPSLSIFVPPVDGSNGWYLSLVTVTATGSDATSGLADLQVRLDGGAWIPATSLDVPEGVHEVEFLASDVAGNQVTESRTLSVDAIPPTVSISLPAPEGAGGWYTGRVEFSASGSDANSGIQSVAYSLDGGISWENAPLSLGEGIYTILTRVTDRAGNITTRTNTVNVDPTPPQSTFTTPPEGSWTVVHGKFTFRGQTLDLTSGPAAAEISLEGGTTWQALTIEGGLWSYPWDTTSLPNGTYTLLVRSRDVAGNEEHTAQVTVTVTNHGPDVHITKIWRQWEPAEISIRASFLPVTGAQIILSDGLGHARTYVYGAGSLPTSFQWDGLWEDGQYASSGDYVVTITAWDIFGNRGGDSGTVRIPVPLSTPTVQPTALPTTATAAPTLAIILSTPVVLQVNQTAAPLPGPSKPQMKPRAPLIAPVYLWPVIALVGLLAALASSSWADKRPSAIRRLAKALMTASTPDESNPFHKEKH